MIDLNLDNIDFSFQEKLIDEVSIVANNILNIHGTNTFDSPTHQIVYEPDHATMSIIDRRTGQTVNSVRDGDGWIDSGSNASADMLHEFLRLQDRLEKEAREKMNSNRGREQLSR
ncbi:MAG: hypothetical protein F6K23_35330 [Okeania sp. SIO2C9]|uniref:hypothetical protein n=1 Tax=Okeania sp. SIO2C9 TaxID=2607791 RepID=UPI0013BEF189|nr:hypothetical protein [Okeania sp. SIO2C9]NEQ77831.1 hypothetical protein [Okeania sp. SIO2C9]